MVAAADTIFLWSQANTHCVNSESHELYTSCLQGLYLEKATTAHNNGSNKAVIHSPAELLQGHSYQARVLKPRCCLHRSLCTGQRLISSFSLSAMQLTLTLHALQLHLHMLMLLLFLPSRLVRALRVLWLESRGQQALGMLA